MNAVEHAREMAAIHGARKFWKVSEIDGRFYVESDRVRQLASPRGGRFIVTDWDAVVAARKVGVVCADDGLID